MNLTEKIIARHVVNKKKTSQSKILPGKEISIKIDQTLTQDATGTLVYLAFESLGLKSIKTKISVSYIDHNTLQVGFENSDDHRYLRSVAAKYGIIFSPAGVGICHQLHLENFATPGETLLGSDSHTSTMGALCMLAIGAGGLDVASALAGEPFQFILPKVINVILDGNLSNFISAKDIILELLRRFSVKGGYADGYNKIFEYSGPALKYLDVFDRATICNMGTELGLTTSIFPSDKLTKQFMRWCGRERYWKKLEADKDAKYDDVVRVDLSTLEPLVACPHSPDNVKKVSAVQGKKINQVCIGSCTNSSYKDLMLVARVLKENKIHPDVELIISPGSRRVISLLEEFGALKSIINSGARILEPACGPCIGMGYAPASGSVSLRTFNRNFPGRSGTKDAEVYLSSTEVAIASAIYGEITNPKKLSRYFKLPVFQEGLQQKFSYKPNFIYPEKSLTQKEFIKISYGPNIKPLPELSQISEKISSEVIIKLGDNISTDDILPAGIKILSLRSNIPAISEYAFYRIDNGFVNRAKAAVKKGLSGVIIAGENYGQGSSREHAACVLRFLGVELVIARSFARIHRANLINFGIIPAIFKSVADYENISLGDTLEIENVIETLKKVEIKSTIKVINKTRNVVFKVEHNLTDREKQIIFSGGLLPYLKKKIK
ncbi:MAG: aconitate hydratase [Elusimicrobiota bacterium]|nr:aconitate hydratase [Elusimicrobiota bacterium]